MSVIYAMIYCNIFYLIYLDIDFQKKKKKVRSSISNLSKFIGV